MTHILSGWDLRGRAGAFFGVSLEIFAAIFVARMLIDIGVRMFFPFIPQLSAGLGLSVVSFGWLLFVRSLAGAAGPVFGILADRKSRRLMMALGLLCQTAGLFGLILLQGWQLTGSMFIFGLGLAAFLPAQQAYIGDQAAAPRRGRALASVEFSWAATAIFILPLVGWSIDRFGWRAPFLVIGLLSLAGSAMVLWRLPTVEHRTHAGLSLAEVRAVCLRANVLASLFTSMLLFGAISCFVTVWGVWLEADFKLSAVIIGLVATAIGLAELTGSGTSSLFIDRIGQKRGGSAGLLITAGLMFLLPLTRDSLWLVIPGLIAVGFAFEFSIVSMVSLYAEQVPEARGTVFSMVLLGTAVGTSAGTPLTVTLWSRSGLWAVTLVAVVSLLVGFGLVHRFLKGPQQ